MNVVIDGRLVLDEADLHRRMAGAFGYGPCYRRDLDDLRRRLGAGDPRPVQLVWTHSGSIRMALGVVAYETLVEALEQIEAGDAGLGWRDRFVFRLLE
ncbi:barstar family protein [Actinoplanes sp. RD1]|uniref:barstar family protein n=1 Tax=Actinoplanes sp. RD1 TaxID=3064538 RepID=UPI00274195AB|nr:barstar family protein [Actinoplanes sp. RD1]